MHANEGMNKLHRRKRMGVCHIHVLICNQTKLKIYDQTVGHHACLPGVPKKSSEVGWNAEKKFINVMISIHSSYMLDILTKGLANREKKSKSKNGIMSSNISCSCSRQNQRDLYGVLPHGGKGDSLDGQHIGCIRTAQASESALTLVQKPTILIPCNVQIAKYFCDLNTVRIGMADFCTSVYVLSKSFGM